jgi:DNA (cytosine-5)-methyltransferase 3A
MKVLSLFDGISGARVALNRSGVKVAKYYSSEVDLSAIAIANKNHPQDSEYRLGDVRDIDFKSIGKVDLLIGGSPCQSFSFVGKREGMVTECNVRVETLDQYLLLKNNNFSFKGHSYLFWEFVRALKELKPTYFLLENVVMDTYNKNVISKALGVEPVLINSALVSGQRRKRLYWFNFPNPVIKDRGISFVDIQDNLEKFRPVGKWVFSEYGGKPKIHKMTYIGADKANTLTTKKAHPYQYYLSKDKKEYRNLSIGEWERLQTYPTDYTKVNGISNTARYKAIGNSFTVDVIVEILISLRITRLISKMRLVAKYKKRKQQ